MVAKMLKQKQPTRRAGTILDAVRDTVHKWLNAPAFFYAIIATLAFQAVWIALSAVYPQAFDENVHFGLIRLHAEQLLPFFTNHIPGGEVFGPIARDPSYFYHFLMSIPYRVIETLTDNQATLVIILRLMNIGLFIWGLFVYRKVLDTLGISRRLRNVVLLFFVLTPIVPLLAAQVNYDNLVFPLTGLLFLYTIRYLQALRDSQQIRVVFLMQFLTVGLLTGIVKYTSLPLFAALLVVIAIMTWRWRPPNTWRLSLVLPRRAVVVGLGMLLILLGGLFIERYAVNLVKYHSPSPDCAAVMTVQQCLSFSPWARDYEFAQIYDDPTMWGMIIYPVVWVHRMVWETMFVIASRFYDGSDVLVQYMAAPPLTVANYTAWTIVVVGAGLLIYFRRRLREMTILRLLLVAILFYTIVLLLKNFAMYLHSGEAVAIHGRYLIPMYPLLYLALALGFSWLFDRLRRPAWKSLFVIAVLLPFLHGAGLVAWLYRSTPEWYWSSSADAPVYQINHQAQDIIHRITIP